MSASTNTPVAGRKLFIAPAATYDDAMDGEDTTRARWRDRLPYAIGVLGLLAWFALLYFMLRDVA